MEDCVPCNFILYIEREKVQNVNKIIPLYPRKK